MREVVLQFRGATYTIPASRAFEVGERVEDIATLSEINEWSRAPKFHKIARCYGEMLRAAGCKVSDADVHSDMMAQIKSGATEADGLIAANAVFALLAMLMDGAPEGDGDGDGGKKTTA